MSHLPRVLFLRVTFFLLVLLAASLADARGRSPEREAALSQGLARAQSLLDSGDVEAAQAGFRALLESDRKYAPAHVGLGHAALSRDSLDAAERHFKQALRSKKRHAPAFHGLGLVYGRRDKQLRRAISYFKDAMRADRGFVLAQYDLARTLQRYGSSETLKAYRKVIKIDPSHPDAHFQIGQIREADGELESAREAYHAQVTSNPEHFGARFHLGVVLAASGQMEAAERALQEVSIHASPFQRQAVLALAGLYQKVRDYAAAQLLFERYIAALEPEARSPFYDLGNVVSAGGTEGFADLPIAEQKTEAAAFWARLDPAPVTEANERLVEHYRRVAAAFQYFGEYTSPWDARGEAYIRYGEPDHVSRSGSIRFETDARVIAVKDRLIAEAGEAGALLAKERDVSGLARSSKLREEALASALSQEQRFGGASRSQTAESSLLGWPVYPVDGIWEYWIYTSVGGGIELTFVQRNYPGPYEYADIPLGTGKIAGIWQRMNPQMVLRREVTKTPSTYRPDFATGPLDFSFYTAGFRADDGQTVLEIYYGIPTRDLAFRTGEGGTMADLSRGTAVYGEGGDPVARVSEEVTVRSAGTAADTSAGSFVPEMDRIVLPPGDYRLAVQVMDRGTGRTQVYRQDRSLKDFTGDQLAVSDVELAARVSLVPEAQSRGRGRFVKGDVEVIPMASRTFAADQPVFIYYEIYNLARDEFGATRYRISYEIRSLERKSVAARVLGGLGKMLSLDDQDGVIRIEYEQLGEQAWENAFLELDMANSEPGIQLLKIRVTDTVSGQVARASATFTTR